MPTVRAANGQTRGVKDHGWLIRNSTKINSIKVKTYSSGKAYFYAYLNSGETFSLVFDDHTYCLEWLCTRRGMRGIKVTFAGTEFIIGEAVRVTDADGQPYHLIACECDNTHQQNKTVCRWCSAKQPGPTRTAFSRGKRSRHGRELEDADYVLPDELGSVWITVNNISVYIHRDSQGVAVDLYPLNDENSDSLSGCYIAFAEAE